jgi:methionyl-tRNA formyltransferase
VNKILVAGNDKVGRHLLYELRETKDISILIDASMRPLTTTNFKRWLKLTRVSPVSLYLLLKMALAELFRKDYKIKSQKKIFNNAELFKIIKESHARKVYLFRAGLIINRKVIDSGAEILNVHCATLPEYGGLWAIMKALNDKAYRQNATLHTVIEKIDSGRIVAEMP